MNGSEETPPSPPKRGRPLVHVDADVVYRLARLGCTNEEIGDWFSCSAETIRTRFRDVLVLGRTAQKMSLRRAQMKRARAGSDAMLIHLGKHMLGQRDDDPSRDAAEETQTAKRLNAILDDEEAG